MKPSEYLRKGWTRYASARDRTGIPTLAGHRSATEWCMLGALDSELRIKVQSNLPEPLYFINDEADAILLMEIAEQEVL